MALKYRKRSNQCFLFSRIIGSVTPKINYLHYLKYFPDQSIQKTFCLILKKEALVLMCKDHTGVLLRGIAVGLLNIQAKNKGIVFELDIVPNVKQPFYLPIL